MLGFRVDGVSVSGGDSLVAERLFKGIGPSRIYCKNVGDETVDSVSVKIGPDLSNLYEFDTSLGALAPDQVKSLRLLGPIHGLKVSAVSASGSELSAWLADSPEIVG